MKLQLRHRVVPLADNGHGFSPEDYRYSFDVDARFFNEVLKRDRAE